ncbi:MAG: hypothetical protein PHS60_17320 [Zavarzinia sp.]|nr:hypothetical protein [Zavarzinia sp.]
MGAVVGRRVEDEFDRAGQAADPLRVQEPLPGQIERQREGDPFDLETEQGRRREEDEGTADGIERALSRRSGEIHVLRRMVDDMGCPEPAHAVAGAVIDVEKQVDQDIEQGEGAGVGRDVHQAEFMDPTHHGDDYQGLHGRFGDQIARAEQEAGRRILQAIDPGPSEAPRLDDDRQGEDRYHRD